MMSRIYDNWEKLVGAVVRREKDRQLAYCESFSSSSSADLSSRIRFEIPFAGRQQPLSWVTRIKVAIGAARALAFLHDLAIPVIYRILKSCNIILDGDFNPKLSGIGLAKDVSRHKKEGVISLIDEVALHGPCAAPEYIPTGMSTECDVYSFGVVLVELISGLQALDRNRAAGKYDLIDWAIPYLGNESRLSGIIDRKLRGQYPHKEAYKVGQIALQCVSSDPMSRPRMAEVVAALQQL